ncbi:hypothetical protein LLG88_13585 [bacterium]|nr:hypothetical protein [bacterium]
MRQNLPAGTFVPGPLTAETPDARFCVRSGYRAFGCVRVLSVQLWAGEESAVVSKEKAQGWLVQRGCEPAMAQTLLARLGGISANGENL